MPGLAAGLLAGLLVAPVARGEVRLEPEPPERVRLWVGAAVTWRTYCARPGVTSCATFDARPAEQRLGDTTDFRSPAPYAGVAAEAAVFPLRFESALRQDVGLALAYQRGFAPTTVTITSVTGSTPAREVLARDTSYGAMLAYRLFVFGGHPGERESWRWSALGLRLGVRGRSFEGEGSPDAALPGVHRLFTAAGVDLAVPLRGWLRIEGAGTLFFQPRPGGALWGEGTAGPYVSEVRDYGTSVSSAGWQARLGVTGTLWGPLGYGVRAQWEGYRDAFRGAGTRRGWSAGGVAEDSSLSVHGALTASW